MDISSISAPSHQQLSTSKQVNFKSQEVITWSDFQSQVKGQSAAHKNNNEIALVESTKASPPNRISIDGSGEEEVAEQQAQGVSESETETESPSTSRGRVVDRVV